MFFPWLISNIGGAIEILHASKRATSIIQFQITIVSCMCNVYKTHTRHVNSRVRVIARIRRRSYKVHFTCEYHVLHVVSPRSRNKSRSHFNYNVISHFSGRLMFVNWYTRAISIPVQPATMGTSLYFLSIGPRVLSCTRGTNVDQYFTTCI